MADININSVRLDKPGLCVAAHPAGWPTALGLSRFAFACPLIILLLLAGVVAADPATQPASQPGGQQTLIVFARSGGKASVTIPPVNLPSMDLVLRAFGRVWMERTAKNQKEGLRVEFDVPAVRVPTVFSITPAESETPEVAQLVAYPDRDVAWDKKVTLYSTAAPAWFDQWAAASGLPVKKLAAADLASTQLVPADENSKALLILGRVSAGRDFSGAAKIAGNKAANVLVLDAEWFGRPAGPADVVPKHMREGLSEIARQSWPHPLKFASHRHPWPGIANRWAWIVEENGLPLVEEVRPLSTEELGLLPASEPLTYEKEMPPEISPRTIASYLPWHELLGRDESADATLLGLLSSAATESPRKCLWHPVWFKYPAREDVKAKDRPILSAIRSGGFWNRQDHPEGMPDYNAPIYKVLDLRGQKADLPEWIRNNAQQSLDPKRSQPKTRLLILGDDPILDDWKWLKLDRTKKTINRPDVIWLSDNELPPSKESQIRLMLKLTELGVPLAVPAPPDSQPEEMGP